MGRFLRKAKGKDLVFFDPDNGMEVPSASRTSTKHLRFDEIERAYREGNHSLLIFQIVGDGHKTRDNAEAERVAQLRQHTGARCILRLPGPYVTFYLVVQPRHEARFGAAARRFEAHWWGFVEVREYHQ